MAKVTIKKKCLSVQLVCFLMRSCFSNNMNDLTKCLYNFFFFLWEEDDESDPNTVQDWMFCAVTSKAWKELAFKLLSKLTGCCSKTEQQSDGNALLCCATSSVG